jgi:acetolactate synthase-1/2/3 large subunit
MSRPIDIDTSRISLQDKTEFDAADLIVSYIEQLGVDFVFGVPGGAIEPLYNALARSARRGGVRSVVARHESGAAFMADGYARETGKIGVCCATTGPGATNMITGVASAYEDHTPMLVITAQTPLATFGRGASQESSCTGVNTIGMFQYCTRYNSFISHLSQLEHKLTSAIMSATRSPGGPAHLSIPLDILRAQCSIAQPNYQLANLLQKAAGSDEFSNEQLLNEISVAKNILFIIGEGCSESIGKILELAVVLDAQVIATPQGKGLISPYHPNFRGVFGLAGHRSATEVLKDPSIDLLIAIGTSLDELATNGWDQSTLLTSGMIHIDEHEENFMRSPLARLHIRGNIRNIFNYFLDSYCLENPSRKPLWPDPVAENNRRSDVIVELERRQSDRRGRTVSPASQSRVREIKMHVQLSDQRHFDRRLVPTIPKNPQRKFIFNDEAKYVDESFPIKPQRLMYELGKYFPPSTRYLADIGNSFLWAIHYLHPYNRRVAGDRSSQTNLLSMGMGFASMGWSIGASIGMALGNPRSPVVCIAGDGSFLMSGGEVTVAIMEKLPVVFVILNDSALGTVKHGQRMAGAESVGHELPLIDFAMLARSMGMDAYTIRKSGDIAALDIGSICRRQGPTLLDVYIDPEEPPPLGERLEMLANGK